jgi:hypothetical protein
LLWRFADDVASVAPPAEVLEEVKFTLNILVVSAAAKLFVIIVIIITIALSSLICISKQSSLAHCIYGGTECMHTPSVRIVTHSTVPTKSAARLLRCVAACAAAPLSGRVLLRCI